MMNKTLVLFILTTSIAACLSGCGNGTISPKSSSVPGSSDGAGSEVATSVVSGAVSGGSSSNIAANFPNKVEPHSHFFDGFLISEAQAATWSCTAAGFTAMYTGPGAYSYAPLSCSVTYGTGATVSATWSGGDWAFAYAASCGPSTGTKAGFIPDNQTSGCAITRTSPTGGLTRTITGVNNFQYGVSHDTTGTNTGYNSSVVPTTDAGVILTCTAANCTSRSLVVSGSHLKGTLTTPGGSPATFWDHTISTPASGMTVVGTGINKVVNGSIVVQHNLAKFTTTSTFNNVGYGDANCCFPTSGTVTTVFSGSANDTKTETMAFGANCGETTFTQPSGTVARITLTHCI